MTKKEKEIEVKRGAFSRGEKEKVMELIKKGFTMKQIAASLSRNEGSVEYEMKKGGGMHNYSIEESERRDAGKKQSIPGRMDRLEEKLEEILNILKGGI